MDKKKQREKKMLKDSSRRTVVLMSGGLDSATVVGMLLERRFMVFPLSVNYGQRHKVELEAMKSIVKYYQEKELPIKDVFELDLTDLSKIGGSALTDDNIDIPKLRPDKEMATEIPTTYVPGRNTILLAIGLAYAEVMNCKSVAIGVNSVDYSGYPDCRPEYVRAMSEVARLSSKRAVSGKPILIEAPLLHMSKVDIIRAGTKCKPKVPYHLTWSCYSPEKAGMLKRGHKPCGTCDSCILRAKGFKEAEMKDPAFENQKISEPKEVKEK